MNSIVGNSFRQQHFPSPCRESKPSLERRQGRRQFPYRLPFVATGPVLVDCWEGKTTTERPDRGDRPPHIP